jgi:hypothetical protein
MSFAEAIHFQIDLGTHSKKGAFDFIREALNQSALSASWEKIMKNQETHSTLPPELAAARNIDDVREWFLGISKQIAEERIRFTRSVIWVAVAGLSLAYLGYLLNHRAMNGRMAAMQTELDQKKTSIDQQMTKLEIGLKEAESKRIALEVQSKDLGEKVNALQALISDGQATVNKLKDVDTQVKKLVSDTKISLDKLVVDSKAASTSAQAASVQVTQKLQTLTLSIAESKAAQAKAEKAAQDATNVVKLVQKDINLIKEQFGNLTWELNNSSVSKETGVFVWKGKGPFAPPPQGSNRPDVTSTPVP